MIQIEDQNGQHLTTRRRLNKRKDDARAIFEMSFSTGHNVV